MRKERVRKSPAVVVRREYGFEFFVPVRELEEFEELMELETNDTTGTILQEAMERWGDEMDAGRREIIARMALAFNQCDNLMSQSLIVNLMNDEVNIVNNEVQHKHFAEIKFKCLLNN